MIFKHSSFHLTLSSFLSIILPIVLIGSLCLVPFNSCFTIVSAETSSQPTTRQVPVDIPTWYPGEHWDYYTVSSISYSGLDMDVIGNTTLIVNPVNPIIDWSTTAVWEYIRERGLPHCTLYDEGFKRLGCVLCPMSRDVDVHLQRWPALCRAWERAVKATFKPGKGTFETAEDYWQWWLSRDARVPAPRQEEMPLFFRD